MEDNIVKSFIVIKGLLLASFVWFFEPLYDLIILNEFLPVYLKFLMGEVKEIIGFIVAILVGIKLVLQIKYYNKETKKKSDTV